MALLGMSLMRTYHACCEDILEKVDAAHLAAEGAKRLVQAAFIGGQPGGNAAGVERLSDL